MSLELRDFRGKITHKTYLALEAEAIAFDRDKADVAREVLHAWALRKFRESTVLARLAQADGISGAGGGNPGRDWRTSTLPDSGPPAEIKPNLSRSR